MTKFEIGDGVRQISTGGTGKVVGIPSRLKPTDRQFYRVLFNAGVENPVPEEDLELFSERRSWIERRINPDRRHIAVVEHEGQCVLESLSKVLRIPVDDIRKMFDDSVRGRQTPSNLNHLAEVLMDNGFVVGQINKNRAEQKGECCFVALRNQMGSGHAVVVMEDNTIFDPEHKFNENGGNFYAQCMANGWNLEHVLVFRKLADQS
jgi:hypothetical protein